MQITEISPVQRAPANHILVCSLADSAGEPLDAYATLYTGQRDLDRIKRTPATPQPGLYQEINLCFFLESHEQAAALARVRELQVQQHDQVPESARVFSHARLHVILENGMLPVDYPIHDAGVQPQLHYCEHCLGSQSGSHIAGLHITQDWLGDPAVPCRMTMWLDTSRLPLSSSVGTFRLVASFDDELDIVFPQMRVQKTAAVGARQPQNAAMYDAAQAIVYVPQATAFAPDPSRSIHWDETDTESLHPCLPHRCTVQLTQRYLQQLDGFVELQQQQRHHPRQRQRQRQRQLQPQQAQAEAKAQPVLQAAVPAVTAPVPAAAAAASPQAALYSAPVLPSMFPDSVLMSGVASGSAVLLTCPSQWCGPMPSVNGLLVEVGAESQGAAAVQASGDEDPPERGVTSTTARSPRQSNWPAGSTAAGTAHTSNPADVDHHDDAAGAARPGDKRRREPADFSWPEDEMSRLGPYAGTSVVEFGAGGHSDAEDNLDSSSVMGRCPSVDMLAFHQDYSACCARMDSLQSVNHSPFFSAEASPLR